MRAASISSLMLALLLNAVALAQTAQPAPAAAPYASQQPAPQQPAATTPATPAPATPQNSNPQPARPKRPKTIADAARASRKLQQDSPGAKVYDNSDVRDPSEPQTSARPAQPRRAKATPTPVNLPSPAAFEAQGKIFKKQALAQKAKIASIQNSMREIQYRFDQWRIESAYDGDAPMCWTSNYNTAYYKGWCDTGRNLKAQYDNLQIRLDQERARLDHLQDSIRRKGYGTQIYDPD